MGGYVLGVFRNSRNWWLASIKTAAISLFLCTLTKGICDDTDQSSKITHVTEFSTPEISGIADGLDFKLAKIEERLETSQDPLKEIQIVFLELINQINNRYGLNLTALDMLRLIRENIGSSQLPLEIQKIALASLELIESDYSETSIKNFENSLNEFEDFRYSENTEKVCWPWEWNWFGLNKKKKSHKEDQKQNLAASIIDINNEGLPGQLKWNTLIGIAETAVGMTFLAVGGFTGGVSSAVGAVLISNGVTRITTDGWNDLQDYINEHKEIHNGK